MFIPIFKVYFGRESIGEEAQTDGIGGAAGELGEVLSGLWGTTVNSHPAQVSGKGYDDGGWQLSRSGRQPAEGKDELGADVAPGVLREMALAEVKYMDSGR